MLKPSLKNQKSAKIILSSFIVGFYTLCVASAWATVTFVKPQDVTHQVEIGKKSDIPMNVSMETKAFAPEPTSLALFGGDLLA